MEPQFIVDINAGKLSKWLRIMGYNASLFTSEEDSAMIKSALKENRIILTKDSQIMKRRLVTSGKLKVLFIEGDDPELQIQQVVNYLNLDYRFKPFSICLECNTKLTRKDKKDVKNQVPPHVYETQEYYMECPSCHRIYWKGTHWQAMNEELDKLIAIKQNKIKGGFST
jgi:uncharacterized protein with PIN domain